VFAIMLGIALGPIMGSGVRLAYARLGATKTGFTGVGLLGVALSFCQAVAAYFVESLKGEADHLHIEESTLTMSESETARRRKIMLLCLLFGFLRATSMSGLEAATVMILETKLGWSKDFTGLAVGSAFVAVVPLRFMYTKYRTEVSTAQWIKRLLLMSLVGSLCLFHVCGLLRGTSLDAWYVPAASALLLVADAFLFSSFYLNDSITQGLLLQYLLPQEVSVFNVNNINLVITLLQDGSGRFIGPPLSRYLIFSGGQNLYAGLQVALLSIASTVALSGFLPLIEAGVAAG
jgi:hypothetical protein